MKQKKSCEERIKAMQKATLAALVVAMVANLVSVIRFLFER